MLPAMNIRNVFVLAAVATAFPVLANSGGAPTDRTGEGASTCTQCHGTNAPAPTITVDGLDAALDAGGSALFTVRIHSEDGTGGTGATCATARCAGFAVSADTAGNFV